MITLIEFGKFLTGQIAFYVKNEDEHNMLLNLIKQVNGIFINIDINTYDKYLPYYAISNNECDCYGTLTALKMETHIKEIQEFKITRDFKDLTDDELSRIRTEVDKYTVEGDLRREVNLNIKTKMEINSYQGTRHKKNLPVRGQRTSRNARTRKGKGKVVANKKK